MFKFFRANWILTKGITELVQSCDCWRVERREQTVQGILRMARDLKLSNSGLSPHQQVMLSCWIAIVGIGPGGAGYADDAIARYARQHGQLSEVELILRSGREVSKRMYGYSDTEFR